MKFKEILQRKIKHYGKTEAAYEFAAEEYSNKLIKEAQAEQLILSGVGKSFTYKDVSKVAEELANDYSSDKKDPVWRDIRQDGIKAIQAFVSKHL
jgi:hypothetical protein